MCVHDHVLAYISGTTGRTRFVFFTDGVFLGPIDYIKISEIWRHVLIYYEFISFFLYFPLLLTLASIRYHLAKQKGTIGSLR